MSGFIGEAVKKMKRGWLEILDKNSIEMTEESIVGYDILDNSEGKYRIMMFAETVLPDPFTRKYRWNYEYIFNGTEDDPDYLDHVYIVNYKINKFLLLKINERYVYPVLYDSESIKPPIDKDNIFTEIKGEIIHPHFGTKRKGIRKAWVGNINNEPELALYSEDYYVYNRPLLPYTFYRGSAVIYNNKIHILGGLNNQTKHYSYDGSSWTEESTLPYNFHEGSAVVYNNKIHILGDYNDSTKHYSYDGSSWTEESTLPYNFSRGSAVVYNNKIHILGSTYYDYYLYHYSYDGSSWTKESTLPYNFSSGSAVVYNNKIHILGGYNQLKKHYSYDGSSWTEESTLPYEFHSGSAVIYNNKIHILGSTYYDYYLYHYSYDGSSWTEESTLPYEFYSGSAVVYNNKIHILGGEDSRKLNSKQHFAFNQDQRWKSLSTLPCNFYRGSAVVYNNKIRILGTYDESGRYGLYSYVPNNDSWDLSSYLPYPFCSFAALVYADQIHILGGYIGPGYQGVPIHHYCLEASGWDKKSDLPYNFYNGSAVVYHNKIHILGGGVNLNGEVDVSIALNHYSGINSNWIKETDLNEECGIKLHSCVVFQDKIYLLGGVDLNGNYPSKGAYWDEDNDRWIPFDMPYCMVAGAAVVYHDEIHIFGGSYENTGHNHYSYDGIKWKKEVDLPYDFSYGSAVVYKDEIYLLGGQNSQSTRSVTNLNHYFS